MVSGTVLLGDVTMVDRIGQPGTSPAGKVFLLVKNRLLRDTLGRFLNNAGLRVACEEAHFQGTLRGPSDTLITEPGNLADFKTQFDSLRSAHPSLFITALDWNNGVEDLINVVRGGAMAAHMMIPDFALDSPFWMRPSRPPALWVIGFRHRSDGARN